MNKIHKGYIPGSIGRVVEMHGKYYADNWKFGAYFEAKVAMELSEFINRYDPSRDAFWCVVREGRVEGSIAIDGIHARDGDAHLRWFIMSDLLVGQGFGNRLLHEAITFCKSHDYRCIHLWTFVGLHTARRLYEKTGFVLVHEEKGKQWGTEVTEQKFVLELA